MNDLQVQQSKAAKIILNQPIFSSSTEALDSLKWKRLSHRRHAHRCIFIFKSLNNLINFDIDLILNTKIHQYNTRQSRLFHLPKIRTNWGKQKLTYHAVNDFNNLDPDCFNSKSLLDFKQKLFNLWFYSDLSILVLWFLYIIFVSYIFLHCTIVNNFPAGPFWKPLMWWMHPE